MDVVLHLDSFPIGRRGTAAVIDRVSGLVTPERMTVESRRLPQSSVASYLARTGVDDSMPKANAVSVLYNSSSTLARLFKGLELQRHELAEVVLVDNGSTDRSIAGAEELASTSSLSVRIVRSTNTGFAGGYRVAAQALSNPLLPTLCVNPDVEMGPGVLHRMLTQMKDVPDAGVVTSPLVLLDGSFDSASIRRLPSLSGASLYAVAGKLLPDGLRYNSKALHARAADNSSVQRIGATTGALMLVSPGFRSVSDGIFDADYWMYGEDLQLCADAESEGWGVYHVPAAPSIHLKGASSGWPRSLRSNWAFHSAMYRYFRKNLDRGPLLRAPVAAAILSRFLISATTSAVVRAARVGRSGEA